MIRYGGISSSIFMQTSANGVGRSNTLQNSFNLNKVLVLTAQNSTQSKVNSVNRYYSQIPSKTFNFSNSILKNGLVKYADTNRVEAFSLKVI